MKNNTPIMIGAVLLVLILVGAGIYAFVNKGDSGLNGPDGASGAPTSIKVFRIEKPNFVVQGENLSKVEIYALKGVEESLLGAAKQQGGTTETGAGETWMLRIPGSAAGANGVFARGYDASGKAAARMDLAPEELKNL